MGGFSRGRGFDLRQYPPRRHPCKAAALAAPPARCHPSAPNPDALAHQSLTACTDSRMKNQTRRRLRFAAGFAIYFAAIWLLWETPIVYPLRIFVVLLHELSHGIAAVATGGTIVRIELFADEGGATWTVGGSRFLTLSAGYLGSMAWGLALIEAAGARPARVRAATALLAGVVILAAILFVRGWFAWGFTSAAGLLLLWVSRRASTRAQAAFLTLIGMTSALYTLLDIRSDILQRPHLESDAHMLMELTGVPTVVWGVIWITLSALAALLVLRRQFRKGRRG
jgi:hypothetical protein